MRVARIVITLALALAVACGGSDAPGQTGEDRRGSIEGSVSYPSDTLPPDLGVCVQDVETMVETCARRLLVDPRFEHGVGYRLSVREGEYYVYAGVPDSGRAAYYTAFVECAREQVDDTGCTDHTPTAVRVQPGDELTGIDPTDWYGEFG